MDDTACLFHLTKEKETLLVTLYLRALDSRSERPILREETAERLVADRLRLMDV